VSSLSVPAPLVIIAQHWPSALVVAGSLGIPLAAVFVNPRFISFISVLVPPAIVVRPVTDIFTSSWPVHSVVIVSGTLKFFSSLRPRLVNHGSYLWLFEQKFRNVSYKVWSRDLGVVARRCGSWDLTPVLFRHCHYGGATNASHLVAFTPNIWSGDQYPHPPNVPRSISHFWNVAADVRVRVCSPQPPVVSPTP
jgi:hypothetical protein